MTSSISLFLCLSVQGVLCGHPTLEPATSLTACSDVTSVKFTCHDSDIYGMAWTVETYIPASNPIRYASGHIEAGSYPVYRRGYFVATLTNITRRDDNIQVADLASELTVTISGVNNGTVISCKIYRGSGPSQMSTTFYHAGLPFWKNTSITYQEKETYFTAELQLGDMFDGGRVQIDHYIIQVDNGTQLETAGPTYSFDIIYNHIMSVNISAHNCAGYSHPFPLTIEYHQDSIEHEVPATRATLSPSALLRFSVMPTAVSIPKDQTATSRNQLGWVVVMVAPVTSMIAVLIVVVVAILALLCIYKIAKSHTGRYNSSNQCSSLEGGHSGPVYDSPNWDSANCKLGQESTSEPDCCMNQNPLYVMAAKPKDEALFETEELCTSSLHIYEAI